MKQIACSLILLLLSLFVGCRSERAAYFCAPAAPILSAAPRLPPNEPPASTLACPAPTVASVASHRDRRVARSRRRWFAAEAVAGVPPPTPAADPAAAMPRRQLRLGRLGRSAAQQNSTQPGLLALAGLLLGLGGLVVLLKLIFDTSFLVAFGVVAGLVVVGLAVLWLVLRNSKGFGWH